MSDYDHNTTHVSQYLDATIFASEAISSIISTALPHIEILFSSFVRLALRHSTWCVPCLLFRILTNYVPFLDGFQEGHTP
jgi:hypothetical protein